MLLLQWMAMELTDDRGADDRDNHGFMESLFPISSAAESDRSAGDCSTTRRRTKWSVTANRALQMGGGTADRYHLCTRNGGGRSALSLFGALGVVNGQRLGRQRAKRTTAFGGATAPKIRVLRQRGQAAQSEYGQSTVTAQRMDSVSTLGISAAAAPGRAGGGRRRGAAVSLARCQCGGRRGAAGRAEHCSFWAPLRLIVGRWPSRWPSVRGSARSPPKWPEQEAAVLAVAASVCSVII